MGGLVELGASLFGSLLIDFPGSCWSKPFPIVADGDNSGGRRDRIVTLLLRNSGCYK